MVRIGADRLHLDRNRNKLADFALASDWAANASAGSKAFNTISSTTGLAAGSAGYYRLVDSTNPTPLATSRGQSPRPEAAAT